MPDTNDGRGFVAIAASHLYRVGRSLTRLPVLNALIPARLRAGVQSRLMARAIHRLPDRRYMEQVILPVVAGLEPRRVLDVGTEWFTRHYGQWFPDTCEYWTLDVRPEVACHGARGRHIIGDVLDVASFFAPGSLDVVLLNGLFGFGIEQVIEQERTIEALRKVLRTDGRLLVGWDRGPDGSPLVGGRGQGQGPIKDPLELDGIKRHFSHVPPPGLPSRVTFPGSSHVYDWFVAS